MSEVEMQSTHYEQMRSTGVMRAMQKEIDRLRLCIASQETQIRERDEIMLSRNKEMTGLRRLVSGYKGRLDQIRCIADDSPESPTASAPVAASSHPTEPPSTESQSR